MSGKISAGVIETSTEKPGVIQIEKSQVKRKKWEKKTSVIFI
jgi:hypothetical protein